MLIEQRIRALLFYLSVLIFFSGLPFIISFSLGYKFDRRTLKFTKTGLVFLKTQPPEADIYLDEKLLSEKTPATLRELLPGTYRIRLELEKHYPWAAEVKVEPRKASLLDKIILFPLRPNIKPINRQRFDYFWIEPERDTVYYVDHQDNAVYVSDLEGSRLERAATLVAIKPPALKWKISSDREKLLYFNRHQIGIAYLEPYRDKAFLSPAFVLNYPRDSITDVFWHSDNYHLVVITDRSIEVLEAKVQSDPVELVRLTKKNTPAFYNIREDALYFIDSQKAQDGETYDNLYKLELSARTFPFQELIKLKSDE